MSFLSVYGLGAKAPTPAQQAAAARQQAAQAEAARRKAEEEARRRAAEAQRQAEAQRRQAEAQARQHAAEAERQRRQAEVAAKRAPPPAPAAAPKPVQAVVSVPRPTSAPAPLPVRAPTGAEEAAAKAVEPKGAEAQIPVPAAEAAIEPATEEAVAVEEPVAEPAVEEAVFEAEMEAPMEAIPEEEIPVESLEGLGLLEESPEYFGDQFSPTGGDGLAWLGAKAKKPKAPKAEKTVKVALKAAAKYPEALKQAQGLCPEAKGTLDQSGMVCVVPQPAAAAYKKNVSTAIKMATQTAQLAKKAKAKEIQEARKKEAAAKRAEAQKKGQARKEEARAKQEALKAEHAKKQAEAKQKAEERKAAAATAAGQRQAAAKAKQEAAKAGRVAKQAEAKQKQQEKKAAAAEKKAETKAERLQKQARAKAEKEQRKQTKLKSGKTITPTPSEEPKVKAIEAQASAEKSKNTKLKQQIAAKRPKVVARIQAKQKAGKKLTPAEQRVLAKSSKTVKGLLGGFMGGMGGLLGSFQGFAAGFSAMGLEPTEGTDYDPAAGYITAGTEPVPGTEVPITTVGPSLPTPKGYERRKERGRLRPIDMFYELTTTLQAQVADLMQQIISMQQENNMLLAQLMDLIAAEKETGGEAWVEECPAGYAMSASGVCTSTSVVYDDTGNIIGQETISTTGFEERVVGEEGEMFIPSGEIGPGEGAGVEVGAGLEPGIPGAELEVEPPVMPEMVFPEEALIEAGIPEMAVEPTAIPEMGLEAEVMAEPAAAAGEEVPWEMAAEVEPVAEAAMVAPEAEYPEEVLPLPSWAPSQAAPIFEAPPSEEPAMLTEEFLAPEMVEESESGPALQPMRMRPGEESDSPGFPMPVPLTSEEEMIETTGEPVPEGFGEEGLEGIGCCGNMGRTQRPKSGTPEYFAWKQEMKASRSKIREKPKEEQKMALAKAKCERLGRRWVSGKCMSARTKRDTPPGQYPPTDRIKEQIATGLRIECPPKKRSWNPCSIPGKARCIPIDMSPMQPRPEDCQRARAAAGLGWY